jgi:hypothetical protein
MIRKSPRDKKLFELLARYEVMSSKQIRELTYPDVIETNFFRRESPFVVSVDRDSTARVRTGKPRSTTTTTIRGHCGHLVPATLINVRSNGSVRRGSKRSLLNR